MPVSDAPYRRALAATYAGRAALAARLATAILAREPGHAGALRLLAYARRQARDPEGALALMRRACRAAPTERRLARELGDLLLSLGRRDEAVAAYEAAMRLAPADLRGRLALATALRRLGRRDDAIAVCEPAAAARDPRPRALLASLLREAAREAADAGDHAAAAGRLRRIAVLGLAAAGDMANLGTALQELGSWPDAEAALTRAVALDAGSAAIRTNLANLLLVAGRYAEAVGHYDAADLLDPGGPARSFNRGHALVALGRLAEGWAELDRHWARGRTPPRPLPEWDGGPEPGGVLLWHQHGVGDAVLSLGMAEEAATRAGRLVVECDPRLLPAVRRSMPEVTAVARGDAPPLAAQLPATRLPCLLRRTLADFPARAAYLRADPARTAELAARYRGAGRPLVVGVAWRSTNAAFGASKSIPLADLGPLFARRPALWVSLQHGDCAAEIAAAGGQVTVDPAIDPIADLDGLLAQIAAVDLVVAGSNTTAHLAGALGKPCWVLLPRGSGLLWHWLLPTGERSPWYPSVRLFRATLPADWSAVIRQAADALEAFAG